MSSNTVYVAAPSDAAIRQVLATLPTVLQSGGQIQDAIMTRAGTALLGRIRQAFVIKSLGGTDDAGDKWKPLSKAYVAYGRRHTKVEGDPKLSRLYTRAKDKKTGKLKQIWIPRAKGRAKYAPSYALTAKQNKRWHDINSRMGAKAAWTILKAEGATTLWDTYANMGPNEVPILRDTGVLLNSLSPGVASEYRVFRVGPGEVIVGTNRKWAWVHHNGSKNGRIPQRRLWPEVSKWPKTWWNDILTQIQQGILDLAISLIKKI